MWLRWLSQNEGMNLKPDVGSLLLILKHLEPKSQTTSETESMQTRVTEQPGYSSCFNPTDYRYRYMKGDKAEPKKSNELKAPVKRSEPKSTTVWCVENGDHTLCWHTQRVLHMVTTDVFLADQIFISFRDIEMNKVYVIYNITSVWNTCSR